MGQEGMGENSEEFCLFLLPTHTHTQTFPQGQGQGPGCQMPSCKRRGQVGPGDLDTVPSGYSPLQLVMSVEHHRVGAEPIASGDLWGSGWLLRIATSKHCLNDPEFSGHSQKWQG